EAVERPVAPHPRVALLGDQVALSGGEVAVERRQMRMGRDGERVGDEVDLIAHGGGLELVAPLEPVEALDRLQGAIEQQAQAPQVVERDLAAWRLRLGGQARGSRVGLESCAPRGAATRRARREA